MSKTTSNLKLFKYDTTSDANLAFNIDNALNDNWDKIDSGYDGLDTRITEAASGISAKVAKAGDTMTGDLTVSKSKPTIFLDNTENKYSSSSLKLKSGVHDYTSWATPTANSYIGQINFQDKNDKNCGLIRNYVQANTGDIVTSLEANASISGTAKSATVTARVTPSGSTFTTAVTPSASSNGTDIATTKWVKDRGYISDLSGYAPINSPAFTGNPTVPTPAASANNTYPVTAKWVKDFAKTSGANYMTTFTRGSNGFYKFTNGLLIEWGWFEVPSSITDRGVQEVEWPLAFTNNASFGVTCCLQVWDDDEDANVDFNEIGIKSKNSTHGNFRCPKPSYGNAVYWLAIGY